MKKTNTKLNKSITSILVASLLSIAFTGCGDKTPEPQLTKLDERCHIDSVLAPEWVCGNSKIEGTMTAVGSAQFSKLWEGFSRREAISNSRSNLAHQIKTVVKDKVETFTRSTGIGEAEVADKVSTQVSKQVAKVTLNGSKQMKYWQSPKTKDIYVLIGVAQSSINDVVKKQVLSSYKNDDSLWQQFQSKHALENLEKEFPTN
ncbi:LPP20 family lipoprotein [Candidatus Sulfurimonas baltica]|uniref:LPP20 family lipoprotein n=1 Tax=Candidatus Sulfurimonas baltica TaxID=2740404 RepID=A0A7S7RP50_9BACT|nr:LPP20 family lipoprotein [Candidatus Sulfurimonas baltica]QOY53219.1 LPP20 family lipoprotein [Candidatus Sulfurimonas baltica]